MRWVHVALVAPLVVVALLVVRSGRTIRRAPTDVLTALRAAAGPSLPAAAALAGATRSEATGYDRESLYQLIDGAAEAYLANGFERCEAADYELGAANQRVAVSAEVHRFALPAGAAAQLAAERPAGAAGVTGLDGTVADAQVLLSQRGRDLLKLVVVSGGGGARDAMITLARAWREER